jgi:hypothetical protein
MRLVKVAAPAALTDRIIGTAFAAGIEVVSTRTIRKHSPGEGVEELVVVDADTSTPKAKRFVADLLRADYYDPDVITFNTRQPRSIGSSTTDVKTLTVPLAEPATDLLQELWQFSHVTYGLVIRLLIASCLLGYGLIHQKILFMIAGLLFLPVLPMLMAVAFGAAAKQWRLAGQGLWALAVSLGLLFAGGLAVGAVSSPPIQFDDFSPVYVAVIVSAAVGVAASLASIDDVGRRELIGLAAASQVGIIPTWVGAWVAMGGPGMSDAAKLGSKGLTLLFSIIAIIIAAGTTLILTRITTDGVHFRQSERRPSRDT